MPEAEVSCNCAYLSWSIQITIVLPTFDTWTCLFEFVSFGCSQIHFEQVQGHPWRQDDYQRIMMYLWDNDGGYAWLQLVR